MWDDAALAAKLITHFLPSPKFVSYPCFSFFGVYKVSGTYDPLECVGQRCLFPDDALRGQLACCCLLFVIIFAVDRLEKWAGSVHFVIQC